MRAPLQVAWDKDRAQDADQSWTGPWSKIWVTGDAEPFKQAPTGEFRPRRWAARTAASVWLAAPLPDAPSIDVKGTWIGESDRRYRLDPDKADRDVEVHEKGGA